MPDLGGFAVLELLAVPEARATAHHFAHRRTGTRWIHLHAPDDATNLSSITIPTPPADSTGAAHILERCVLAAADRGTPMQRGLLGVAADHTFYRVAALVARDLCHRAHARQASPPAMTTSSPMRARCCRSCRTKPSAICSSVRGPTSGRTPTRSHASRGTTVSTATMCLRAMV